MQTRAVELTVSSSSGARPGVGWMTSPMTARVLVVDDDLRLHELLSSYLGQNGFVVERALDGAAGLAKLETAEFDAVTDFFAAAQFEELTDAEKLSRASFERMQAGVEVASASVRAGPSISAPLEYESAYRDPEHGPQPSPLFTVPLWMQQGLLSKGLSREGGIISAGTRAYAGPAQLSQAEEQFVVVSIALSSCSRRLRLRGSPLPSLRASALGLSLRADALSLPFLNVV